VGDLAKHNNKYRAVGQEDIDRNKVYSVRAQDPLQIPVNVFDIPNALQGRFDDIGENEVIFESELMKYKPGIRLQYMSRWC